MKLVVKELIEETPEALTISFKNGNFFKKLSYKPGQFLTLHVLIKGEIHKRAYSFCSNPYTDKDLKITIKRVQGGLVSNYVHDYLKVGDKLSVDNPAGSFCVIPEKSKNEQYVLFAGGSGITPIFSIIKSILTEEEGSNILLIYANQNAKSIIFHQEIKQLIALNPKRFNVEHVLSNCESCSGNYSQGQITNTLLKNIFAKYNLGFNNHQYMICGPNGYMEKVKEILKENGITREQIKLEVFKAPKVKLTGKNLLSEVVLKLKGEEYNLSVRGDKSILQQALSDNVVIPYSCRSGMCSSCKAKCLEGEVKMIDGHIMPHEEVSAGNILTCVSYPVSEKVVIEF
ncbi:ferredoxin--NADP reductase [Neotamlana laminarinivorans]|uniref:Ferredoxin--NADP reductase n=1 Tax=Neotamlana laminarinivorans TaxID=2883124 RepID=A0A9X1I0P0_9FLAO|nr:ferredoxin--NADP reductase [Tamlana laminarinivorans]MCB4798097.1 ferredoxin--NADP reductase [Tamlana laminarinivorans]